MPLRLLPAQGYLPGDVWPEAWHLPTWAHLRLLQPRADSDFPGPWEHVFIESLLCAGWAVEPPGLHSPYSLIWNARLSHGTNPSATSHNHHPSSERLYLALPFLGSEFTS